MSETRQEGSLLKMALEIGPLAVFFLLNSRAEAFGITQWSVFAQFPQENVAIMAATAGFMIATAIALTVSLAVYRKVPVMPLVSGVIVMIFGGLTLYLQDELFIKLKPTIVNLLFAGLLLVGLLAFKRPLLKVVFGTVFVLDEEGWWKLTFRWGLFFLFLAALNEVVWRSFSTDFWVSFKVFGIMPITVAFTLTQLPLIQRHTVSDETAPTPPGE